MIRWMAAFLMLACAAPAPAQTLARAFEQAWERHPQAAALAAREDEARAGVELAAGLTPGPAALSLSSRSDRLQRDRGKQEWEAEMAVPLWLPGQQPARAAEAESALDEVAARRAALRLQLAGELREAWWALAAARNSRELARQRVQTALALESDVRRRYEAGDLARIDANLAQGERLAAETEALEAEAAARAAEQAWRQLAGAPAPAELAAEGGAAPHEMAEGHPLLAAAAAAAQAARNRLRAVDETRRDAPELALRVMRERETYADPYANTVGVRLTIPFSSGPRLRRDNAAARAEAGRADAELALLRQKLQLDVERARLEAQAAERQLALARQRRDLAADNLRLADKSFSLGEADLATLLRIRAGALEAESLFRRQQVAHGAANSRLRQAYGALP